MTLISLDLKQARSTAHILLSSGQLIDELRAQLQSQWTRLAATWEGHSHDLIEPEIQTLCNRWGQVAESVRERGTKLVQIADRFQAADENEPLVVPLLAWASSEPSPRPSGIRLPDMTTMAVGEEGQQPHLPTDSPTLLAREKGHQPSDFTTLAVGEEGQQRHFPPEFPTLHTGEEGRQPPGATTLAVGEEGQQPPDVTLPVWDEEGRHPPYIPREHTGPGLVQEIGWEPLGAHRPKDYLAAQEIGLEPPSHAETMAFPEEGFEPPNPDFMGPDIKPEDLRKIIADSPIEPPQVE